MTNEQLYASITRQIHNTAQEVTSLERQFEKEYRNAQDEAKRKEVALKFEMDKAEVEMKVEMLIAESKKVEQK